MKIADLVLKSKLFTSTAGDQRLFFRHRRIKHDKKHWPKAWKEVDFHSKRVRDPDFPGIDNWVTSSDEAAEQAFLASFAEGGTGCPFSWLFQ